MNKVVRLRTPEQFRREAGAHAIPRRSIRRTELTPSDPGLLQTDNLLHRRVADELDFIWRQLDSLGNSIANDGIMAARHGAAVPTLDRAGRTLGQLAAVLRCSSPEAAVGDVPNAELRGRLQRSGSVG